MGFVADDIADLLVGDKESDVKDDDSDQTVTLEKSSFVERGDIWTVGKHRFMCGDATFAEDVARLMDGKKADLIVTDPSYGASVKSSSGLTIQSDSMKNDEFYAFLLSASKCMADSLKKVARFIFSRRNRGLNSRKAFIDVGYHLAGVCIWVKNSCLDARIIDGSMSLCFTRIPEKWQASVARRQKAGHHLDYDKPKRNANHAIESV